MRILFYAFPQVLPQGPQFNTGWTAILASIMRGLEGAGRDECGLITGRRFAAPLAAQLEGLQVAYVDELALLNDVRAADPAAALPTEFSRQTRAPDATDHPAVRVLLEHVLAVAGDFAPDLIVTFSMRAEYLKGIWPAAEIFYVEGGAFSRFPYPFTLFFDHLGMYAEAGPSQFDPETVQASEESVALAETLSARTLIRFRRTDPFARFDFRSRFERLALFPLAVSNFYSFDEQSPYRTQFEFLADVLSQSPPEVGVIVTEYVQWGEVLHAAGGGINLDWLRRAFPNMIFHEAFRKFASPSQYLVDHVDGVYTIGSNLGYQSLLYGKRLGCGPQSFLGNVAHDRDPAAFFRNLAAGAPAPSRIRFLAWYLERYLVPESLYTDGTWMSLYLGARMQAIRAGLPPAEAYVPVADPPALRALWLGGESAPRPATFQVPMQRRACELAGADLASAAAHCPGPHSERLALVPAGTRDAWILLNDTRRIDGGLHMGCNAVTTLLETRMAAAGLACLARLNDAAEFDALLASPELGRVRIAVLNGEGSVHHDSARMRDLMALCVSLKARGIPSVLINSVWHENTALLGDLLAAFSLVSMRESRSLEAVRAWRGDARCVPDLSFAAYRDEGLLPAAPAPEPSDWTVIDHVDAGVTGELQQFAEAHAFPFHLMGRLHVDAMIRDWTRIYEAGGRAWPRVLRSPMELEPAGACLTGRFHGLTAALSARVPVVAIASNTPKVEGMLADIGIAGPTLLADEWLGLGHYERRRVLEEKRAAQGAEVSDAIERYLARAAGEIEALLADVLAAGR